LEERNSDRLDAINESFHYGINSIIELDLNEDAPKVNDEIKNDLLDRLSLDSSKFELQK
jgi:hypothetical protein